MQITQNVTVNRLPRYQHDKAFHQTGAPNSNTDHSPHCKAKLLTPSNLTAFHEKLEKGKNVSNILN
jgi:hypothetical protein